MKTTISGDAAERRCPRIRTPPAGCSPRVGRAVRPVRVPAVRSRGSRVAAPPDGPGAPSAAVTVAAPHRFRSGQRGATTIGVAIAVSFLVAAFASLMGIVNELYIEDRTERGARAGARAVSLLASAPASEKALKAIVCKAVERELGEDEGEACACWTIAVEAFETPQALSGGHARGADAPHGGENADMVLVRLRRPYWNWNALSVTARAETDSEAEAEGDSEAEAEGDSEAEAEGDSEAEAEGDSEAEAGSCPDTSEAAEIVVAAVARNEREIGIAQ